MIVFDSAKLHKAIVSASQMAALLSLGTFSHY